MTGHGSIESAVDAMKLAEPTTTSKSLFAWKNASAPAAHAEKVRLVTEKSICTSGWPRRKRSTALLAVRRIFKDVLRMISG